MKVQILLTLDLAYPIDRAIGRRDLRNHVEAAIEGWGGQYHPDDVLFDGIKSARTGGVKVKA